MPRPEPLPLLSSALFETPPEQLRSPDDPTGGVVRPGDTGAPLGPDPDRRAVIRARPTRRQPDELAADLDDDLPASTLDGDELVILPLDADPEAGTRQLDEQPTAADGALATAAAGVATQQIPAPTRRLGGRAAPTPAAPVPVEDPARAARGRGAGRARRSSPCSSSSRPTYLVPELTGMPVAEARNLVAPNDWEIDVQGERSDDVPIVGQVVRTAPAAGVELAEGEPFLMIVSEGPLLRELPDSTGKPLSEAQTALAALRLGVETVEQFDEVVPPGTVIMLVGSG